MEEIVAGQGSGPGNKKWWGPRIWRILHSLAEISDRIDCGPAWRTALTTTADMLPCAVCRAHFVEGTRSISLRVGLNPRITLRHQLWSLHASTGGSLSEEGLSAEYDCSGNRNEVLRIANSLIEEVITTLRDGGVYDRFTVGRLVIWQRAMHALMALVQTPAPNMSSLVTSGRRRLTNGTGNRRRM
jgi:hypothetical protein